MALTRVTGAVVGNKIVREYDTVQEVKDDSSLKVGMVVQIKGRANALFDVIAATTNNGYDIIDGTASGVSLRLRVKNSFVSTAAFGVPLDGVADSTEGLWACKNWLETNGGRWYFDDGTYNLSIAGSESTTACLEIPANVEFFGSNKNNVTIQRLPSERGTNGVLIVNHRYDEAGVGGNYSADGNIWIHDVTIDEGAATPTKGLGNLIGFGNGDGLIVENCHFGNHDQHAIDIAKSRNVWVRNNTSNNQVNASASATYQIDAGLIWGIDGGTTKSYNVFIHDNIINGSYADKIIHFHSAEVAENVHIFRNTIDASNLVAGQQAIGGDADISYDGVHIHHNEITLNHVDARGINLPSADTVSKVRDLNIYKNKIKGVYRIAVYIGDDSPSLTSYDNSPLEHVRINENELDVDLTTGAASNTIRLLSASHFKHAEMKNNKVRISINGQTVATHILEDKENGYIEMTGNEIKQIDDGSSVPSVYHPIVTEFDYVVDNALHKHWNISNNRIDTPNCRYHLFTKLPSGSLSSFTGYSGKYSGNRFIGTPSSYNMYEAVPVSDGTNNLGYVDMSSEAAVNASDPYVLDISSGSYYTNLPLTGTKNADASRMGKVTLDLIYSPLTASGFSNDTETISNVYISGTQAAGTIVKDIDAQNGVFDIVTGSDGVSMIINDSSFQPVLRTSGFLKILSGI